MTTAWCEYHSGEPADNCVVCSILREDQDRARQRLQDQKRAVFALRMASVSVGARYQGKTWEDFKPPCMEAVTALGNVRAYANDFDQIRTNGTTLFLLGNPGTGKNLLAAVLCSAVVEKGYLALHTTAAKLIRRIRESWRRDGEGETAAIQIFTDPDFLVIDEVGMQRGTDDEAIRLFDVINERYEAVKPTAIISNLNVRDMERYLTTRTMERMLEKHILVPFTWSSYRRGEKISEMS